MAFFDFLDNIWKPVGKGLSEADTFMNREMPFHSSWGAPAALVATYFGGPAVLEAMGSAGEAGSGASMLDSIGGSGGSFGGDLFQIGNGNYSAGINPSILSSSDTGALNKLAAQNGVSQGEPSWFDNLIGNNEQGLYDQQNGNSNNLLSNLLKNQQKTAQQNADVYGHYKPTEVVRQPAFLQTPAAINVQEPKTDLSALIKALRG